MAAKKPGLAQRIAQLEKLVDHLLSVEPHPTKRKKKAPKPAKNSAKAKDARLRKKIRDFW